MQQIKIQGLNVETLIGVYDWERTKTTTLVVDLVLEADLRAAMRSDNVEDTIDYAKVAQCVQAIGAKSTFELLEAFGFAIMQGVMGAFPVSSMAVEIEKPGILPDAKRVAVAMTSAALL